MNLECICGEGCVEDSLTILKKIKEIYPSCIYCKNLKLKKFKPLKDQIELDEIDENFGLCTCGKRYLDTVIAHILKIMMDEGIRDENSTLRDSCTPLITPAYPTNSPPYLRENSMVILTDKITKNCADKIINEIPEVKGVLYGDIRQTVGLKDSESEPNIYKLLAGCDMRCDVICTPYGELCIYRNQAEIHVELPKPISPKIEIIKKVLDKYKNPTILDSTCGPGTLGITCLKAGAKKVVFNDIWYPAIKMTLQNLQVNGYNIDCFNVNKGLIGSGENFQVYCQDINKLKELIDEKFDICIIDTFPGVNTENFINSVKEFCSEIIVIS